MLNLNFEEVPLKKLLSRRSQVRILPRSLQSSILIQKALNINNLGLFHFYFIYWISNKNTGGRPFR
ncbi:hypothetical protein MTsPCn5_37530 [Croceitalea sp. MTPC5]|nr:hypothetical protein MTsPCn5_37530 [Croceitalea sp. MTPC5]